MVRFYYDAILGLVHWDFSEPLTQTYSEDKHKWVTFNNGSDKKKLRQYISDKANRIAFLSMAKSPILKRIFIEAYDLGGIEAVDKVYQDTIKKLIKSANS